MLLDAEGSKYFLFLDDGARFDGDEPPGCKVARPAFARFSRHLGLMGGRAVIDRYWYTLTGFSGAGIVEIIKDCRGDTFRAEYTLRYHGGGVCV